MDEFPVATSPAPGIMNVDWEQRVDVERLRSYRLGRVREQLERSDLGALLLFETSASAMPPVPTSATGPSTRVSGTRW